MCIFCNIIEGKIPCDKVYEDDKVLAFLDISPISYGHTLVIPKKHYANMEEIDSDDLYRVILVVKKIGQSLKDNLGIDGYNIQVNNNTVAGQIVPHLHFHLIPRVKDDGLQLWSGHSYKDGEVEDLLSKIKIN